MTLIHIVVPFKIACYAVTLTFNPKQTSTTVKLDTLAQWRVVITKAMLLQQSDLKSLDMKPYLRKLITAVPLLNCTQAISNDSTLRMRSTKLNPSLHHF
jgi:hypothetical protein